ncbi:alpha-amylase family protein [Candidatus Epulonipiscium viviparus]|uniref:alpha-amylase family protein n=1 Tax=Candidatus Epulonipiscium viviparus TaxID=420336 RepID=UPI0027380677|nr:alpha-amylase family protein [Candidatus Epulopiscium viviparus]
MNKTYHQIIKKLHLDMHTPENILAVGNSLDIDKYVATIKASGAESVTVFARCGYGFAYFPTKIGVPHPNMKRDLFGDIVKALRAENIDVTAYFSTSHISTYQMERDKNFGWAAQRLDKTYYLNKKQDLKTYTPCPTGNFIYDNTLAMIIECATNYDINGIWIDGLYGMMNDVCYCDRCQEAFAQISNLPFGSATRANNRWRTDIIWKFINDVSLALKEIDSRLTVGADIVGCLQWSLPKPQHEDFITYDPQPDHSGLNISLSLAYTAFRGVTSDMNIQRMRGWGHFNSRPLETLYTDAAVCAAMNSMLIAGDIVHADTATPDIEAMKNIAKMFEYGASIHSKVKDIISYADVAILSSPENTRADNKSWKVSQDTIAGVYQCVLSAGLAAHVLFDEDLPQYLNNYKVLIIPELAYIGAAAGEEIKKYVAAGGKILVTGNIPKTVEPYASDASANAEVFEELIGLQNEGILETPVSYLATKGSDIARFLPDVGLTNIAVYGPVTMARATTATTLINFSEHGPVYQYGALPIGNQTEYVGISENTYGQGCVFFMAQPVFNNYTRFGDFLTKRLIHGIILENITPYGRLFGASNAQLVVAKSDTKVAASIIVFNHDLRKNPPTIVDGAPKIAELKIRLTDYRTPTSVTSVRGDKFAYSVDEAGILIEFDPLKIYAGVVINFD